jgi:glutathione-regulated potassium-efflux system ancillary protein KefG
MNRILILFAHPKFEQSRANKALIKKIENKEGVTFHDLYERYPDFNIDIILEKKLLAEHNVIIWQYPSPPLP